MQAAMDSPDTGSGMQPVEEDTEYSHSEQRWGAGISSPGGAGTLLEMKQLPDICLEAGGPSTAVRQGSSSSSEVCSLSLPSRIFFQLLCVLWLSCMPRRVILSNVRGTDISSNARVCVFLGIRAGSLLLPVFELVQSG